MKDDPKKTSATSGADEYPDEDTKEIEEEMKQEGFEDPAASKESDEDDSSEDKEEEEDSSQSKSDDEKGSSKSEKSKDDSDSDEDEEETGDNEDDENLDDEDSDDLLDDEDEEDDSDSQMMPVAKHTKRVQKLKNAILEMKSEIEGLKKSGGKKDDTVSDDDVDDLADKYNVDSGFVRDVVSLVDKRSKKFEEKLEFLAHAEEDRNQDRQYQRDFSKRVMPLIKEEYGDNVKKSQVKAIETKLKEKAFDPEFAKTRLDFLYAGLKNFRNFFGDADTGKNTKSSAKRTAEKTGKRTKAATKVHDFASMNDKEANEQLNDEEFDEYSEFKAKQSGGRLIVSHKN